MTGRTQLYHLFHFFKHHFVFWSFGKWNKSHRSIWMFSRRAVEMHHTDYRGFLNELNKFLEIKPPGHVGRNKNMVDFCNGPSSSWHSFSPLHTHMHAHTHTGGSEANCEAHWVVYSYMPGKYAPMWSTQMHIWSMDQVSRNILPFCLLPFFFPSMVGRAPKETHWEGQRKWKRTDGERMKDCVGCKYKLQNPN